MSHSKKFGPILGREFYSKPTVEVARSLLGTVLTRKLERGGRNRTVAGRIVETEAYLPEYDPSCHAARGRTKRNDPMFGPPGSAYVYFIYGNYFCLNVVTEREGVPGAALIRAIEPLAGLDVMRNLRGREDIRELANGPSKLCQALAIDAGLNRTPLGFGSLVIRRGQPVSEDIIVTTTRIGIKEGAELPLRFLVAGSSFVSRKA